MNFEIILDLLIARFAGLLLIFFLFINNITFVFAQELSVNQSAPLRAVGNQPFSQQANPVQDALPQSNPAQQIVGQFFDTPIPLQNYFFIKGAISVFGNKWGPLPQTAQDLEKVIWDQLLMSFEAFRRGIEVNQDEVNEEVNKILSSEKAGFDWKKDRVAYEKWVKDKTGEPAEIFEGQLKHLIQLHKLRQQVMESIDPSVSEREAYQEFLNESNSLSVELVQFDEKKDADDFYKKVKNNSKFWDEEKSKRPNDFKRPGAVSLEFLIDIWGFKPESAYGMMKSRIADIYQAAPIYKGYAVFKILAQGHANKSSFKKPSVKKSYYDQIRDRKRLKALVAWIEDLKKQANIRKNEKLINELSSGKVTEQVPTKVQP